jgi:hypothetical protein
MMKKGFALTLLTVAIALVQVSTTHATAPVISNPGDVIIGDLENAPTSTSTNVFVAPDIINADQIVTDDTPDNQIKWSFTSSTTDIEINGVPRLDPSLTGLGADDPTSPRLISRLDLENNDDGQDVDVEDGNARTFTFRDVSLSPNVANPGDTGPAGPPGLVNTNTITLFASDCTTFSAKDIVVFSIRGESDGLSGGGPEIIYTADFTTTDDGWIGGNQAGFGGTVASGATGLCMTVPAAGNNLVLWVSPDGYIELVNNAIYRVRTGVSTDQTAADAIPFWFFIADNAQLLGGPGGNFGHFAWVLDVDGGAQGIGRANGRTSYDFWFAPNAVATPQWQSGAFTVGADPFNDLRLQYQVIDANAALQTQNDSGTICVENIEVARIDHDSLQVSSTVYNPPLDTSTHFAGANNDFGTATAAIDNNTDSANIDLSTTGDVRRTVGPFDPLQANLNLQLYPVVWTGDTLFRTRTAVRAATSEADPVDALFIVMDTTNNELGTQTYTLSNLGVAQMSTAASPKLVSAEYEAYHYSQNATDSVIVDANRLRPQMFVLNGNGLFGTGNGGDAVVVESLEVDTIVTD